VKFDPRQKRLALACLVAAFVLPSLSGGDGDGGYWAGVARYLFVGGLVVALVPRLERWRARSSPASSPGAAVAPPARAGNAPGAAPARGAWSSGTQQVVTVPLTRADAFERALQAVQSLRRVSVTSADAGTGCISARTGPTLRSIGELVEVKVEGVDGSRARVDVYSKARVTMTSSDRLKAEENVVEIVKAVRAS
jgi:hypothetical protein